MMMKAVGRAGLSVRLTAAVVMLLSAVSLCTGAPELLVRPPDSNERIEDELVAERVAAERLKENRNRAFGAGYLAVAPKIMCAGGREKVFITFVNFTQPVDVMFTVMEDNEKTLAVAPLQVFNTPCGCVELDLPHIDQPRMTVTLTMFAKRSLMQCDEFEIVDKIKVYLDACNSETFIETDKPIYKSGQRLQFRVLTLQSDLRPDLSEVSKIWVESPSGIHMAQWLGVGTEDGLIDLSMPLSTDPPLGEWKIKVRHHDRKFVKTFQVGEYVLPKFEVMIEGPEYVVIPGGEEEISVCGRYIHGQPVRGSVKLYVYTSNNPQKQLEQFAEATDMHGCHTFTVDLKNLDLKGFGIKTLVIKAELEDAATRVLIKKTRDDIVISDWPSQMEFSVPSTFKPGLPFSGMLLMKDPNGKPLAGEVAEIVATSNQLEDLLRDIAISNDKGIAFFSIQAVPSDVEFISLQAATGQELGQGPRARAHVKPQYSPSKSYLHIDPVVQSAKVNSFQPLTISMASEAPDYNGVYLHTVMMSRGNILLGVDMIIPPEEIDGFRRPGQYGVYPINTDEMGMKEYSHSLNMKATDIPIHFLQRGKVKTTHLRFKISYEMSPSVTVMVYYIMQNGEVVADTVIVPVDEVFQNQVSVTFAESEKQPGQVTRLNILAKPSSLCAYGAVDKSVYLLGDDNRITKEKVFKALEDLQLSAEGGFAEPHSKRCQGAGGYGRPVPFFADVGRYSPHSNAIPDASQSFKDLGVVYLTNLQVETAPCPEVFPMFDRLGGVMNDGMPIPMAMPVAMMAESVGMVQAEVALAALESQVPDLRSYFPETWLYGLIRVSPDGQADVPVLIPHSITEWIGHGFCTSTRFGAGVSELTKLTVFQPFFVDLSLPYSVIRYELVPVTAVVFNYVTKCLVVELTLQPSDDFKIEEQNRREYVCVCGGESKSVSFYIQPVTIGNVAVQVHAISVPDSGNWCEQEIQTRDVGFGDAIVKELLVKPEGIETEQVFSTYFCPTEYAGGLYEEDVALRDLPDNYVPGSKRAVVTVTGDMLGPTIDNLDHLLQIPTGCGEQNMIGFVPNILIMHYLKGINQLSADVEAKAKENMQTGYQRELTYRHADGSYSAFGDSDPEGSTWLTAFVVRSFSQARRFIYIDAQDLEKSKAWLTRQQRQEDGCFEIRGKVIHKDMMGKVNDVTTLTAYVVISLIEAGVPPDAANIQKAIGCLQENIDIATADMYTLGMASYAYILAGYPHRDDVLTRLDELAVVSDDGLKHWEGRPEPVPDKRPPYLHHQASSQHIEITSYALLTYIRAYSKTRALLLGRPISRWIMEQRNANGGFASTQDTVMALQALAEYGVMAYVDGPQDVQLQVKFSCEPSGHWLYVMKHNRLLLQTLPVPQVPVQVKVTATGPGCAMTQVIMKYNVLPEELPEPPFQIDVTATESRDASSPCSTFTLAVCAEYQGNDKISNMAVIQVRMVSGFEPDANSLDKIRASNAPRSPKRVDVDGVDVFFYFDQLDHDNTCVEFTVNRVVFVQKPRDGAITVFDYYERALSVSSGYSLKCGAD